MEDKYYLELMKLRMERAKELLGEVEQLLENEAYKSANNRAYYAVEKAINALLVYRKIEVKTHNGAMKMLNVEYVRTENACFTDEDYRLVSKVEQIRNSSDYDDFYVTSKEEARQQVASARYFVEILVVPESGNGTGAAEEQIYLKRRANISENPLDFFPALCYSERVREQKQGSRFKGIIALRGFSAFQSAVFRPFAKDSAFTLQYDRRKG